MKISKSLSRGRPSPSTPKEYLAKFSKFKSGVLPILRTVIMESKPKF